MKKEVLTQPYLTFKIGSDLFAVELSNVVKISDYKSIEKNLFSHNSFVGNVDINGYSLPVLDIRDRLGIKKTMAITCSILILSIELNEGVVEVGLIVDQLNEIDQFNSKNVFITALYSTGLNEHLLSGIVQMDDKNCFIINLKTMLFYSDMEYIRMLRVNSTERASVLV